MSARIVIAVIAFWTMIQALGYVAMAVFAILAHNCQIDMNDSQLSKWLYAIYFRDNACGSIDWNNIFDQNLTVQPILPEITLMTFRTNTIALVYLAISILWTMTSLMLIVGAFLSSLTKCTYYFLFHPWIYASLLNILLDLTATGFFIYDLVNSFNLESFLRNLEVENINEITNEIETIDRLALIPPLIMIAASMRAIVIWIFNIIEIFVVVRMGKELVNGKLEKKKNSAHHHYHADYITESEQNNEQYNSSSQLTEQTRYNDPPSTYQYDNQGQEYHRQHPPHHKISTSSDHFNDVERRKRDQRSPKRVDEDQLSQPRSSHSRKMPIPEQIQVSTQRDRLRSSSSVENDENRRGSIEKPTSEKKFAEGSRIIIDRPHLRVPKPPAKPRPQNSENRDSTQENRHSITQPPNVRRTSGNPTDELRSQLPWSYFNNRNDVTGPKKPFHNLRADEDLPPVPVPDYTIHFPKKDRLPSTNEDDGSRMDWT